MATSRERNCFTGFAAALTSAVAALVCALIFALVWADAAAASQAMMAILVYGASALVVESELIGALRRD